jgi:uncharacterized protein YndB with AHSA1/START domain
MAQSSAAAEFDRRPSLTITRRLRASPQKVYAAWTRAQNLIQWFATAQAKPGSIHADLDVRAGGRYRISFTDEKSGEYHEVGGVYREAVPDARLQFTWAWHSTPERESLVTIELKGDAAGTLMIFRHEQFADETARDNHERGWNKFLDTLEAYLA